MLSELLPVALSEMLKSEKLGKIMIDGIRCHTKPQRAQLPGEIRELVLDDQRLRNEVCWSVFDC